MTDFIIDDGNYSQFIDCVVDGETKSRGLLPRRTPYGAMEGIPVADTKLIPVEEWPDRIADQDRQRSSAWHVWNDSPIGVLDQDGYSFCHGFSAVDAAMIERHMMGLPYIQLSPSSVAAPVTGYRNAGAWIEDDLRQMVKVGVATTEFVPMLTARKSDFKAGWESNAGLHKVVEWQDGKPRDYVAFGSELLAGRAVCIGLDWWSHAITALRLRIVPAAQACIVVKGIGIATEILNSWRASWGTNGCATLAGRKGIPDEWYVLRQATPSPV